MERGLAGVPTDVKNMYSKVLLLQMYIKNSMGAKYKKPSTFYIEYDLYNIVILFFKSLLFL